MVAMKPGSPGAGAWPDQNLPDIGAAVGAVVRLGLLGHQPLVGSFLGVVAFVGEAHAYTTCPYNAHSAIADASMTSMSPA
jgi:hypothetical protein